MRFLIPDPASAAATQISSRSMLSMTERRQGRESKKVWTIAASRVCTDGYFDTSLTGDTYLFDLVWMFGSRVPAKRLGASTGGPEGEIKIQKEASQTMNNNSQAEVAASEICQNLVKPYSAGQGSKD